MERALGGHPAIRTPDGRPLPGEIRPALGEASYDTSTTRQKSGTQSPPRSRGVATLDEGPHNELFAACHSPVLPPPSPSFHPLSPALYRFGCAATCDQLLAISGPDARLKDWNHT